MGHERDMRCVLNDFGECLARVPGACLCRQMPRDVWLDAVARLYACGVLSEGQAAKATGLDRVELRKRADEVQQ